VHRTGTYVSFFISLALAAPAENALRGRAPVPQARPATLQLQPLFADHYRADPVELARSAGWMSEYDLAVALHLVRRSRVDLDRIVAWRREGGSWDAITRRCGLSAGVYHVPLPEDAELPEPYARPYQRWRANPGADQRLTDEEVRELVILRALSQYCAIPAEKVVRSRAAGQTPEAIIEQRPVRRR
jgi:hypothetical protein